MQSKNKFMDDMSQIMTNAMGIAQGAKDEAENAMKSFMDRWLADRNFVTREEFDAVRAMAQKARAQNDELSARLEALEAAAAKKAPNLRPRPSLKRGCPRRALTRDRLPCQKAVLLGRLFWFCGCGGGWFYHLVHR